MLLRVGIRRHITNFDTIQIPGNVDLNTTTRHAWLTTCLNNTALRFRITDAKDRNCSVFTFNKQFPPSLYDQTGAF